MNGLTLAGMVEARLEAQVPARTVYVGAVPDGALPRHYLVVWSSEGSEEATRSCDTTNVQTPVVWVTSVSRNADPHAAAREAAWAAGKVREALRNWRPEGRWKLAHGTSAPARRDESIPATTFYAVEQFTLRSTI